MQEPPPRYSDYNIFTTPDGRPDCTPEQFGTWTNYMCNLLDKKASEAGTRFYNPLRLPPGTPRPIQQDITWPVFPQQLTGGQEARWKEADERREVQDEYCEWNVTRNAEGKITKVVFSCELPEYWEHLAKNHQNLLNLYKELNPEFQHQITVHDLYDSNGKYNPMNRWNCGTSNGCIAHMIQKFNKLDDLVELAARATIIRRDSENVPITDGPELVRLAGYTSWKRNSDPHICEVVNGFARKGNMLTVGPPIGVSFVDSISTKQFRTEHRDEIPRFWYFARGHGDKFTRLVFELPPQAGYVLGDVIDRRSERKIEYGSQLAELVQVKITGSVLPWQQTKNNSPLWSFIAGRTNMHTPLSRDFVNSEITDWFGRGLVMNPPESHPITFRQVIEKLGPFTWVPYVIHEGIHLPGSNSTGNMRIVIICTPENPTSNPNFAQNRYTIADENILAKNAFHVQTVCISGGMSLDNPAKVLELAAFDPAKGWFNYYSRVTEGSTIDGTGRTGWLYFGSSKDAFDPRTRGKGVFCGHPNGAPVMKELEKPWLHWHSSMSTNWRNCVPPDSPILQDPVMNAVGKADSLELIVVEGIKKWFDKRRQLDMGPCPGLQLAQRVRTWIAHALLTTTVNIGCSIVDIKSVFATREAIPPPKGMFYNEDCLEMVIEGLGKAITGVKPINATLYLTAAEKLGLSIVEKGNVVNQNEGQAPFIILTPSREDTEGLRRVLSSKLLPRKHLAAMLMVDFCNPIYSWRRAELMKYIPDTATPTSQTDYDLSDTLMSAIHASPQAGIQGTPEAEFLYYMGLANFDSEFTQMVTTYLARVGQRLQTQEGVDDYLRLAESRRRIFNPPAVTREEKNGLAEFDMTLPVAGKLDGCARRVVMRADGEIEEITDPEKILLNGRNSELRFRLGSKGCPLRSQSSSQTGIGGHPSQTGIGGHPSQAGVGGHPTATRRDDDDEEDDDEEDDGLD